MICQLHRDDTIKMDSNPAYESYTGLQPNPSYDVNKPSRNTADDQYDYAQPTQLTEHHDREGNVSIQSNPSYGVIRGEGNNIGDDVTVNPNPSYGVATRMTRLW